MLSCTLQDYKNSYKTKLSAHLNDYEDNTQTSFLERELNKYTKYYNLLINISDYFKNNTSKNFKMNSEISNVISALEKIQETAYNEIFTIEKTKIVTEKVLLENGFVNDMILHTIPGRIEIDFKKLNNYITSAKRILDFISEQLTIPHGSSKIETSLYLTGKLPQGTSEQQSAEPEEEIVDVKAETKVKSEKSEAVEHSDTNDFTKSTIHEYLEDIVDDIKPDDYKFLTDALYSYFTTGKFPLLERKIMFKRVNKKKVGWALKEVYKNLKTENLDIEYFRFAKENINLFAKEVIEPKNFYKSNFYKMFTTNPAK